jgi:hypothetical protein
LRVYKRYFVEKIEKIEVVDIQLFGESPAQNDYLNALVDQLHDLDLILQIDKENDTTHEKDTN